MIKREKTISAAILLQMVQYMKTISIDSAPLLELAGIPEDVRNTPDVRISAAKYMAVQQMAVERSGDPWFGLHMGTVAEFGNWAILGYVVMNCSTVGHALKKMNRYLKAISDMITTESQPFGDGLKVQFSMSAEYQKGSSHCIEASLSSQVYLLRKLTGSPLESLAFHFPYPEPESIELYEHIFGTHLFFNQPSYAMILERQVLEMRIVSANPQLLSYFEQYANRRLEEAEDTQRFTKTVSDEILKLLSGGVPLVAEVARALSISVRGLQERLKQEGSTYSEILDRVRVQQMNQYLEQGLSADEITFLLGFSEVSVFRKACKKWTGLTLGQYMRELQGNVLKASVEM